MSQVIKFNTDIFKSASTRKYLSLINHRHTSQNNTHTHMVGGAGKGGEGEGEGGRQGRGEEEQGRLRAQEVRGSIRRGMQGIPQTLELR